MARPVVSLCLVMIMVLRFQLQAAAMFSRAATLSTRPVIGKTIDMAAHQQLPS